MKNTFLQKTKTMIACMVFTGLATVFAPETFAAQVSINLSGFYTFADDEFGPAEPFSATISFDSETAFQPFLGNPGLGKWVAGDFVNHTSELGSISVTVNGVTQTTSIYNIFVQQSTPVGPTYSAGLIFFGHDYTFQMAASESPIHFTWGPDLLPTESYPIPFWSPYVSPQFLLSQEDGERVFTVDTFSVTGPAAVPLPATAWLFGAGLLGLGGLARQRRLPA